MVVDYLSSQPDWAGYQVSTKQGSGPFCTWEPLSRRQALARRLNTVMRVDTDGSHNTTCELNRFDRLTAQP